MPVFRLPLDRNIFPHPDLAEPDGLIAIGGDLSYERLLQAYLLGFFPWYNDGDEILWWHPHERMVLFPDQLKVSKSMRPYFNGSKFRLGFDQCFREVITACAEIKREGQEGTWINSEMLEAYIHLHQRGIAHSVEVYEEDQLVGGLYGLALGRIFFGESMFSRRSNASKFGFISLVRALKARGFVLIDCQQETRYLSSLGAKTIHQEQFLHHLSNNQEWIRETGQFKLEEILF